MNNFYRVLNLLEKNPYHDKDGEFTDQKDSGSWSLYFDEPEEGRQQLVKGSRKTLPNKVLKKGGRSGKYKLKLGKNQDLEEEELKPIEEPDKDKKDSKTDKKEEDKGSLKARKRVAK